MRRSAHSGTLVCNRQPAGDSGPLTPFGETGRESPGGLRAAAPAWQANAVLRIPLRGGPYGIKPLDLLLFTAIGPREVVTRGKCLSHAVSVWGGERARPWAVKPTCG